MKQTLKIIILPWLFVILFGSMLLALYEKAGAAHWTEGKLITIIGLEAGGAKKADLSKVELLMDNGTFGLSHDVRIRNEKGSYVSIDTLEPPYEVRFISDGMIIKEINIIKVIPR
jgi:hypothetical protein